MSRCTDSGGTTEEGAAHVTHRIETQKAGMLGFRELPITPLPTAVARATWRRPRHGPGDGQHGEVRESSSQEPDRGSGGRVTQHRDPGSEATASVLRPL